MKNIAGQTISSPALAPPLNLGDRNLNPPDIGLFALLREDYVTHGSSLLELGVWAIWTHRLGNWRMKLRPKLLRAPFSLIYKICYYWVSWFWGIKLDYTVKLGRRVRIWHHGGMILGAREIGDDVHIRQNTTFGLASRRDPNAKPVIGKGVEIGTGAVILGNIHIGDYSVIGANAVVTRNVPAHAVMAGVPAKLIKYANFPQNDEN
jgi:serine O-acetyltransferase